MRPWWRMGLLSCFGAAVVSVAAAETAAPAPLADSAWELVSVQSMDDAIGTTTVEDPSLYTLRLDANGNAAFRLLSKDLEAEAWRYSRTDSIHSFYAPGSQEESRAFSALPWQQ